MPKLSLYLPQDPRSDVLFYIFRSKKWTEIYLIHFWWWYNISLKFTTNMLSTGNTNGSLINALTWSMYLHWCSWDAQQMMPLFSSSWALPLNKVFWYFCNVHSQTILEKIIICTYFHIQRLFYVSKCHYNKSWFGDIFLGSACIICVMWASCPIPWWSSRLVCISKATSRAHGTESRQISSPNPQPCVIVIFLQV